jgi:hypothetical protein
MGIVEPNQQAEQPKTQRYGYTNAEVEVITNSAGETRHIPNAGRGGHQQTRQYSQRLPPW